MKFKVSSHIMYQEEVLNIIIKNFCDEVLASDLDTKQRFMLNNKLATIEDEGKSSLTP